MRRSMRLIAALLVVGAVGFGASAALGTTGSSTAGPLAFSVTTADSATKGTAMAWSGSVTNNASVATPFKLTFTLSGPLGKTGSVSYYVGLGPNASLSKSGSFRIPSRAPSGTYTLTMSISNAEVSGQTSAQTAVQ
jgi:hypothetical protein